MIKHGALGDIIKAFGVFRSLAKHYEGVPLDILTTPSYASFFKNIPWFDQILLDSRGGPFESLNLLQHQIPWDTYDLVVDLQNSKRTNRYGQYVRWFLNGKPLWSGSLGYRTLNYPFAWKRLQSLYGRFVYQLNQLGINLTEDEILPDLSWLAPQDLPIKLPQNYVILIPGSSPGALEKRWPAESYGQLARELEGRGLTPILVGGPDEVDLMPSIMALCPGALNLCGKLSLLQLAHVARGAKFIVGNDTGPLYLVQASGNPTMVLWSDHSVPEIHAPRGPQVRVLQRDQLSDLSVHAVLQGLEGWF